MQERKKDSKYKIDYAYFLMTFIFQPTNKFKDKFLHVINVHKSWKNFENIH